MPKEGDKDWIDEEELESVNVKWNWSRFDGAEGPMNAAGDHNFTIILDEPQALDLEAKGWAVRRNDGYEDGDPDEYTLKIKVSFKYEGPKIFLIKNGRKFRCSERDLADIRRDTCENLDVIIQPSRWVQGGRTGVTAYAKELFAVVKQSRFADKYDDLEEI